LFELFGEEKPIWSKLVHVGIRIKPKLEGRVYMDSKPLQINTSDRPIRETIIQNNEFNLIILLNTTSSVSEFLEKC